MLRSHSRDRDVLRPGLPLPNASQCPVGHRPATDGIQSIIQLPQRHFLACSVHTAVVRFVPCEWKMVRFEFPKTSSVSARGSNADEVIGV